MSANLEKFVIELGLDNKDFNKLKKLLKVQDTSQKKAEAAAKKENALQRKILQTQKLINAARKAGMDISSYQKSLNASKKIETIEKNRIRLDREFLRYKEDKQSKQLNTQKKITQEIDKQAKTAKAATVEQQIRSQKKIDSFGAATRKAHGKLKEPVSTPDQMMFPSKALFQAEQKRRQRMQASDQFERKGNVFAGQTELKAKRIGLSKQLTESLKKQAKAAYGNAAAMGELRLKMAKLAEVQRKATMQTKKQNLAMQGLNDSTRHFVRSYASVFAVLGAATAINRTGQKFEAMNSAMLAATGTSEMAAEEVAFLDKMTSRLGLSLLDTSDAYTKFLFASKGKLDQGQTRELFEGLSELGTTLGVSKERMKLSMNAITQMMNKGKISSEELRLQLAESMPGK